MKKNQLKISVFVLAIIHLVSSLLMITDALSQEPSIVQQGTMEAISNQMAIPQTPVQQQEALSIFGYSFFHSPQNIDRIRAFSGRMFPDDYRLGPGDRLGIYLLGKTQLNFDVVVNVEGKIFIPTVGVLFVTGLSISEFQDVLNRHLVKYYDNFSLNIMLIEPKQVPVTVVGDVERPGKYYLSSLNTVLDAVLVAGGPTRRGSLRNIHVYRQDSLFTVVDLYKFLMEGETKQQIFLQPHDKIVVPLIEAIVAVRGEVKRPARFELKFDGKERLSDLLTLAGNFTDLAFKDKIEISRLLNNGERLVMYVDFRQIQDDENNAANIILKNEDQIQVFSILEQRYPKSVYIHGEVKRPGHYSFEENLHLLDLLLKAGNLTRSAYMLRCEVAKVDPKAPTDILAIDLQQVINNPSSPQNILLEEDDRVFIRRIPEWEVGPVIEITGEVQFAGIYAITEDSTTLFDVMTQAGGFTDEALIREASLIRRSSTISIDKEYERLKQLPRDQMSDTEYEYLVMKQNNQDIGRIVVDFFRLCISKDLSEDVLLEDGDIIHVPKAPKVVYVTGRVSRPGGVVYVPGKNIKYYIKKAGGVTWDAKRRSTKVTKVTGEILDDEDVSDLLAGDIIWVPRKPDRDWWELFRYTIAVVAQLATVYIVVDSAVNN
ncbi:MAG: SLBB domain-containing protein [Candidatus Zhuqueibacterota bacterium]